MIWNIKGPGLVVKKPYLGLNSNGFQAISTHYWIFLADLNIDREGEIILR